MTMPSPTAIPVSPAPSKGPRVFQFSVTPDMAERWLAGANDHNRPLVLSYCERLARDMRQGRWQLTHEGIAFSPHGRLIDGQHRLKAVMLAGVPVEMHVWFDVPPESLTAINCGRTRTLVDALTLSDKARHLTHNHIATLRVIVGGMAGSARLTAAEAAAAHKRHQDALEFAHVYLPNKAGRRGIATGVTCGVVARAYYSADLDRLAAFCAVLTTGMATAPDQHAAVLLFNWLVTNSGTPAWSSEQYRKVERALAAFLQHEPLAQLRPAATELFPLPDENIL